MFICTICYANHQLRPAKLPPKILNNFGTNSVHRCKSLSDVGDNVPEDEGYNSCLPGEQKDAVEKKKVCSLCMMKQNKECPENVSSDKTP